MRLFFCPKVAVRPREGQAGDGIKFPKFQSAVEKEVPRFAIKVLYNFREVSTLFASALDE